MRSRGITPRRRKRAANQEAGARAEQGKGTERGKGSALGFGREQKRESNPKPQPALFVKNDAPR